MFVCFHQIFREETRVHVCQICWGKKPIEYTMIWDFGCFPWSCTNLVIEQLTIPSSKHLTHPVAYFIHEATSVAKANAGKSKFYIEHVVPPS